MKEILDKYQLNPTNCVFLGDSEDNTIVAEKLGIKVIRLRKEAMPSIFWNPIFKLNTLYFVVESFFVNKILQNDIYKLR